MSGFTQKQQPSVANLPDAAELWFLNTRVHLRISTFQGADGLSIVEHWAPVGDSPPLHVHRNEDEVFHILDGEFRFLLSNQELKAGPGAVLLLPKLVPHTYRVESSAGGHFMTTLRGGDFERFIRAFGRPAEGPGLPPPAGPPTAAELESLAALARRHGIELRGPPLS
jgi:quercetin dioxygenase-like cupin family protein